MKDILILNYQDNFADNFSCYTYGKILEHKLNKHCVYENNSQNREIFENKMKDFNLTYDYISTSRVKEIAKNASFACRSIEKGELYPKLAKEKKNYVLNLPLFQINDIKYINKELIESLKFKNLDFIINYDILGDITSENSIGIYISKKDIENNLIDNEHISCAIKRLNKYIKQPILYVFTDDKNFEYHAEIRTKTLHLSNWREEFYFLICCKNKIILNSPNSYSQNLWASILSKYSYSIIAYKKSKKIKSPTRNWVAC